MNWGPALPWFILSAISWICVFLMIRRELHRKKVIVAAARREWQQQIESRLETPQEAAKKAGLPYLSSAEVADLEHACKLDVDNWNHGEDCKSCAKEKKQDEISTQISKLEAMGISYQIAFNLDGEAAFVIPEPYEESAS